MSFWDQWRPWLRRERKLLIELALMLVTALVIGSYFLERFSTRLETEQQHQLQALATQTARRAAEVLASEDAISLNLIARETLALSPVALVRFETAEGEAITSVGTGAAARVQVPVALPDGEPVGQVRLGGKSVMPVRQRLETGYVLLTLALLLLRVGATYVQRRWGAQVRAWLPPEWLPEQDTETTPSASPARVSLRLSLVNFDRLRERYTREALAEVLSEYRTLLASVAASYGGDIRQQIGDQAQIEFSGQGAASPAVDAAAAALLFLQTSRRLAPERKARQALPLEFKALLTHRRDTAESWSLCVAGVPGRLHVPADELAELELDGCALYQPEKARVARGQEDSVQLQPVERLAPRYQQQIAKQADELAPAAVEGTPVKPRSPVTQSAPVVPAAPAADPQAQDERR